MIAKSILKIKKVKDEKLKRIIKKDRAPKREPKSSLIFETFLFKTIDIPRSNIKSYKKLTKKT